MSRLVVVSNRVVLPSERVQRAGGLAVAIREALARSGGLWFGWSGELVDAPPPTVQTARKGKMDFAVFDLTPAEFWARCDASPTLPETAAPSPVLPRGTRIGTSSLRCRALAPGPGRTQPAAPRSLVHTVAANR